MFMDIPKGIGILAAMKSNPRLQMTPPPLGTAVCVFLGFIRDTCGRLAFNMASFEEY